MTLRVMLLLTLCLTLLIAPLAAQDDDPLADVPVITDGEISFPLDPALAANAAIARLLTVPLNEDTPAGDEYPAHTLFTLLGYEIGDLLPSAAPTIAVYDVATFEEAGPEYLEALSAMRVLLDQRPDLDEVVMLPYLPVIAPSQVFVTRAEYLSFNGGAGLRYLTLFAFDVSPALEGQILYTFQGLTTDETRYVAATFPLNTGLLDTEYPADFDYNAFIDTLDTYFADLLASLSEQAADAFTPDLDLLDALIAGLTVGEGTAATVAMQPTPTVTLAPTAVPTLPATPFPGMAVEYSRFQFTVDFRLAGDWAFQVIPGAANNPATPPGDEHPSYVTFTLPSYRVAGVYPAAINFYLVTDRPGDFGFDGVVTALQTLLEEKPPLAELDADDRLPFPPLFAAEPGFQARAEYLSFPSGEGVRYLTMIVQDDAPPVEGAVFYTFQGLTSDGRYLVSAMLPVETGLLPAELPDFDINQFNPQAEGFFTDLKQRLEAEAITFTPALATLDALISTIVVGP